MDGTGSVASSDMESSCIGSLEFESSDIESVESSSVRAVAVKPSAVAVALTRRKPDGSPAPFSPTADTR